MSIPVVRSLLHEVMHSLLAFGHGRIRLCTYELLLTCYNNQLVVQYVYTTLTSTCTVYMYFAENCVIPRKQDTMVCFAPLDGEPWPVKQTYKYSMCQQTTEIC